MANTIDGTPVIAPVKETSKETHTPNQSIRGDELKITNGRFEADSVAFRRADFPSGETHKVLREKEFETFVRTNRDLISIIDQSEEAQKELKKVKVESREDLQKVIGRAAFSVLKPETKEVVSEDKLIENTGVASLILLNSGGVRDIVEKNKEVAKFLSDKAPTTEALVFKKAADKVAAFFKEDSPLSNPDFFEKNPKIAVFINENPEFRDEFITPTDANTKAQSFIDRVDSDASQLLFDNFITTFTAEKTDTPAFNQDFFRENPKVAEFVGASSILENSPRAAEVIKKNPQLGLNNSVAGDTFNFDRLVRKITAIQAKSVVRSDIAVDSNFFFDNQDLSNLVIHNQEFRKAFNSPEANKTLTQLNRENSNAPEPRQTLLDTLSQKFKTQNKLPENLISVLA